MDNKFLAIVFVGAIILAIFTSVAPVSSAKPSSSEICGLPVDTAIASEISWNATNWPAFYYSMNEVGSVAETLKESSVSDIENSGEFALKVEDEAGIPAEDSPGFALLSTTLELLAVLSITKNQF